MIVEGGPRSAETTCTPMYTQECIILCTTKIRAGITQYSSKSFAVLVCCQDRVFVYCVYSDNDHGMGFARQVHLLIPRGPMIKEI